jgi:hypothetical protein
MENNNSNVIEDEESLEKTTADGPGPEKTGKEEVIYDKIYNKKS